MRQGKGNERLAIRRWEREHGSAVRDERWGVWCECWGGVTGHRETWLKGLDKEPKVFATRAEAEAEAARLTRDMNGPYRTANYRYSAEVLP